MKKIFRERESFSEKFINKLKTNYLKKIYKISFLIISLQFFLFLILISRSSNANLRIARKLLYKVGLEFDTIYPMDYLNYGKEFFSALILNTRMPKLDLKVDYNGLLNLDCNRQKKQNCKNTPYSDGELTTSKDNFRVKVRAKGDRDIHRINLSKMSFKVDIKGEKRYLGMEEFSIQMPIIRNYTTELFAANLLRKNGISTPRHKYVKFFINGEYKGIRHIEESISKELIESSAKRYGPVFSLDESNRVGSVFQNTKFDLHDKKFWEINNPKLAIEALTLLENSKTNKLVINKHFDLKLWAEYFAFLDSMGMYHGAVPKSVKFFLNPVTGLIEPIFFDGHLNAGRFDDFYLFDFMQSSENNYGCEWICDNRHFFQLFLGEKENINNDFFSMYKTALKKYVSNNFVKEKMYPEWQNLRTQRGNLYKEFWRVDRIWYNGYLPHVAPWAKLNNRFNNIRELIKISEEISPKFEIDNVNKTININNKFSRIPQIVKLKCNKFISRPIVLIKNKRETFSFSNIQNCNINNLNYSINNYDYENVSNAYVVSTPVSNSILKFPEEDKMYLDQVTYSEKLFVNDKEYMLDSKDITFASDLKICLPKSSILHIKNSKVLFDKNVFVSSCNNDIGGSIIIENSEIKITDLNIDSLTSPIKFNRVLYGGLNIINSNVNISQINIKNSKSEDGINFINSDVFVNNINLENTKSDAIDSDFSKLDIKNINCKNIGNDCLDLSYSKAKVEKIYCNIVQDKGISLGEASDLKVKYAFVKDSEIGLVSKDSSNLFINEFEALNVRLPISAYIKKSEFDQPSISINKVKSNNPINYLVSKDSLVLMEGKRLNSAFSSRRIEKMLYGNLYGSSTVR